MLTQEEFDHISPSDNLIPLLKEIKGMLGTAQNPRAKDYRFIIKECFFDPTDIQDVIRLQQKIVSAMQQNGEDNDRLENWLKKIDSGINQVVFWNPETNICSDDFLSNDNLIYYAGKEADCRGRELSFEVTITRAQIFHKHSEVPTMKGTPFQFLTGIYADLCGLVSPLRTSR